MPYVPFFILVKRALSKGTPVPPTLAATSPTRLRQRMLVPLLVGFLPYHLVFWSGALKALFSSMIFSSAPNLILSRDDHNLEIEVLFVPLGRTRNEQDVLL